MCSDDHRPEQPRQIKLQACLASPDDESEYRYLVNGKDIQYITIDPGVIPEEGLTFEPVLNTLLPPFPLGDWNTGHITKDASTGAAVFASTSYKTLPGVKNIWHHTTVDHLQLTWIEKFRQNIRIVSCPLFDHPVVYNFAEFPWQAPYFQAETTAYEWIDGHGIGPRFLAHVTEAGRVIGFVFELIKGRTAEIEDLEKCERVLKRLHAFGIKHGDTNKHNFLIRDGDEEAVLIDFDCAVRSMGNKKISDDELVQEFQGLRKQLEENTGRGGVVYLDPGEGDET